MDDIEDELADLRIVKKDDEKIIAPARWMPRLELTCRGKTSLLLGGHRTATNSIMVWCTCPEQDSVHPESSRLMALDSWVIEHCMGEDLDDYDDEGEEEDKQHPLGGVDELCMEEAHVIRVGANVLPKQVPLRQLLASTLVAQGGNRGLRTVSFWVYWYDQPIPTPRRTSEYKGLGHTWVPGPLARSDLGVWYRARIEKCDTTTGEIKVKYSVDSSEDSMYLLVAFAHFAKEPPTRGSRPEVLPHMDMIKDLGLPPSASSTAMGKARGRIGTAVTRKADAANCSAKAAAKSTARPVPAAPAKASSGKPQEAGTDTSSNGLAATAAAAPEPGALHRAHYMDSAIAPLAAAPDAAAAAAAQPVHIPKRSPVEVKLWNKRPASPSRDPSSAPLPAAVPAQPPPSKQPPLLAQQQMPPPTREPRPKKQAVAARRSSSPNQPEAAAAVALQESHASAVPGVGTGLAARPAASPRHEFELVPLASVHPASRREGASAGGPWPAPPLSAVARAQWETRVQAGRTGFRGWLCGQQREQVPVPVFNDVDAAPPPVFEYLSAADFEERLDGELAAVGRRQPAVAAALEELRNLAAQAQPRWGQECGQSYHDAVRQRELAAQGGRALQSAAAAAAAMECSYNVDGRLLATRPLGVHECSSSCSGLRCSANMQLTRGVRRPLEVFRRAAGGGGGRGGEWALRCAEPLEPGDFVAPLVGRLVAAQQLTAGASGAAESLPGAPDVVLLNHFFGLWEAVFTRGLNWCEQHVRLWQLPPNPLSCALQTHNGGGDADDDPARPAVQRLPFMLALDTRHVGNVSRFVRQWKRLQPGAVGPALVAQPVLAGGCRSPLLYYLGLFAARRVEAGEELVCDWSSMELGGHGPGGTAGPAR